MKKRISVLALFMAIVMCFCGTTLNSNAAVKPTDGLTELSKGYTTIDLTFSQNVGLITYSIVSHDSLSSLEIHVRLERYTENSWERVSDWSKTVSASSSDGSYTKVVYEKGRYCATLWGYAIPKSGPKEFFCETSFAYYN